MTLLSLDFSEHTEWIEGNQVDIWPSSEARTPYPESKPSQQPKETQDEIFDLIVPHLPSLRRYLMARLPVDDVDDVVQDVLMRILRRVEQTSIERPKCYLFQAAQATLIDRHRKQSSRKATCHCELMEEMHPVDDLHSLHILIAREEFSTVGSVLEKLPERTREIVIAVRLEGVSLKSLASRYAISTSAIEKHITRAQKALERAKAKYHCDRLGSSNKFANVERHLWHCTTEQ